MLIGGGRAGRCSSGCPGLPGPLRCFGWHSADRNHGDRSEEEQAGSVTAVKTESDSLPCYAVVLACGPDAAAASADLAGIEVPTHYTTGLSASTTGIPPIFRQVTTCHTPVGVHLRQLSDGSVMFGYPHEDTSEDDLADATHWLNKAATVIPALADAEVREVRRARRPIPQDGQSSLGFTEACPNLYLASTHSGVTLAPAIGEFAAIEISDDARVDQLSPFRLERFN